MTTLQAGDIAIIGANFDNPDKLSFVVLTDITAGTAINFTDNGVKSNGDLRSGEGTWKWTTNQAISAGTIISINNTVATQGSVEKSGGFALSGRGDQIIAYQGSTDAPNYIYAVNSEGNTWQADATSSNTSALPTGLTNGTTAVAIPEVDNFAYTGTTSGTKAELLQAISNPANWTNKNNSTAVEHISTDFTVNGNGDGNGGNNGDGNSTEPTYTLIHDIQGDGAESAMQGKTVTINAIITAYTPNQKGFYVQEQATDYDANPKTSEGIFVYFGNKNPGVTMASIGDTVTLTGQVKEFYKNTQISYTQDFKVTKDGTVADVPAPTVIKLSNTNTFDMESVEGMNVTVKSAKDDGKLVVTETYNLGRYGEVVLTSDEVQVQYTETNAPDKAGNSAHVKALANDRIIIEDANTTQNPKTVIFGRNGKPLSATNTLRGGDSIDEVTGVVNYAFGNYKIQPTNGKGYNFTGEDRPTAADVHAKLGDAEIKVASANVLNFFTTQGKGEFTTPYGNTQKGRGADNPAEYSRQLDKLVAMIKGLDADVVGLMEIQNNGYGDQSALKALVDALNAKMGAGTYDYIKGPFTDSTGNDVPTAGNDAIMVGMIYKPANVTPVGKAVVPNATEYPAFSDNGGNRVPLAQAFKAKADGEVFTTVVNHFKSKGSVIDADQGDGQGNNPVTRLEAAKQLQKWLDTDPTGTGDKDNLLIGDFNGYSKEDALQHLEDNGYDRLDTGSYSYVYKGVWGNLDHAFASNSLVKQGVKAVTWEINANEPRVLDYNTNYQKAGQQALYNDDPYRASDHNPVLIGLNLSSEPVKPNIIEGTFWRDNLTGTDANDKISGGFGSDIISGGKGRDELIGGFGNDTLHGGQNADWLKGGWGYDTLDGGTGNDKLDGGFGKDNLNGGDGMDTLIGGLDADTLTGGKGADVFVYNNTLDSVLLFEDVITDFKSGEDKIDLSAIDADTTKAGNQAFELVDASVEQLKAGQVQFKDGQLVAHVNNDSIPDMVIKFAGLDTLIANDVIL